MHPPVLDRAAAAPPHPANRVLLTLLRHPDTTRHDLLRQAELLDALAAESRDCGLPISAQHFAQCAEALRAIVPLYPVEAEP